MNFTISAFTHNGTFRKINQDRILVNGNLFEEGVFFIENQDYCSCFVADGVGGNQRGEFASQFILEKLKANICSDFNKVQIELEKINSELLIISANDPNLKGTASTLTGLYIDEASFYIFHVGDSQLWLNRNDLLFQVTTDQILDKNISNSPITSYFGGYENLMRPQMNIFLAESEPDDLYILCSDGLFKSLENNYKKENFQSAISYLKSIISSDQLLNEKNDELLKRCLLNGAPDNISVVLIHRSQ